MWSYDDRSDDARSAVRGSGLFAVKTNWRRRRSPPSSPDGDCTATSELADALRESVNELLTYKNDQLVGDQKLYALRASSEEVLDVVNSVEIANASK